MHIAKVLGTDNLRSYLRKYEIDFEEVSVEPLIE